ncbi:MAG: hypothetical protein IPJ40_09155 [Saprospirales bacterium]|nr:hypothetical protein [Saprospirales bacterium]
MKTYWLKIALLNFFLAACLGVLMRYAFVEELEWMHFRHIMHAHSHVAMLGWLYLALYALLIGLFLKPEQQASPFYNWVFWATEVSVVGMLVAFPIYGYTGPSGPISFLHVVFSWLFIWRFWRDLGRNGPDGFSEKLVRTALIFMMLSAVGIFVLMVYGMGHLRHGSTFYMAIQFFLHFQFNGWFLFAILALFFKMTEEQGIVFEAKRQTSFYWLLVLSCMLTYALAVAWAEPHLWVFALNSVGVLLQLAALAAFYTLIWPQRKAILAPMDGWMKALLLLALVCFSAKILIQTAVALPFVAKAAYTIRNYVIGFFHLILLGMATSFIWGFSIREGVLTDRTLLAKLGLGCWVVGFLGSEAIILLQGTLFWGAMGFLPYYYEGLFGVSLLIPVGVGLFLIGQMGRKIPHTPTIPKTQTWRLP